VGEKDRDSRCHWRDGIYLDTIVQCEFGTLLFKHANSSANTLLPSVRRNKYRHYYSPLPCYSSLGTDPYKFRLYHHHGEDLLGHGVCYGAWGQLWSLQHRVQRLTSRSPMARYSWPETHPCPTSRLRPREPPHHCHRHGGRLCHTHHPDIHHEVQQTVRSKLIQLANVQITYKQLSQHFSRLRQELAPDAHIHDPPNQNNRHFRELRGEASLRKEDEPSLLGCVFRASRERNCMK